MALLTETELTVLRERHERAVLGGVDTIASASAAHADRERLLDAVEQLLPIFHAARIVEGMIQRGPLPPAARSALLELHVALRERADAHDEATFERAERDDEEALDEDVRLSA
jgi:hypothetical protein